MLRKKLGSSGKSVQLLGAVVKKDLGPLSTDTSGKLDVLGHDGDALGVDGAQVGVLE